MTGSVLVAYGTKHGSTGEVAAAVAGTLREAGIRVVLQPAAKVHSLAGYDGVVLGGAIYMGRLHHDVRKVLSRFQDELADLPVAVFAMGPRTTDQHDLDSSREQLDAALARFPEVSPFSVAVFGGVLDPAGLRFPFNRMPGADARDWDAVREWATEIASTLAVRDAAGVA